MKVYVMQSEEQNLISVIVPAYNIREYLPRCLDSLLAQIYGNLEIIVVDDGSTDGTAAVADGYACKDPRIKVIHKENGGVTSARLRGVTEATGNWIGFVDGDDSCEPEMYARLLENALAHGADISHCGYQMRYPDRVEYYHNTGRFVEQDRITGTADLLLGEMIEPGLCNKLYHKTLLHSLLHSGNLPEDIRINEDLLMNFYLFRQSKRAIYEDFCPYHYILRKGSASKAQLNEYQLKDPLRVSRILLHETKGQREWNSIAERRLVYQLVNIASMELGRQRDLVLPFRSAVRKELRQRLLSILNGNFCGIKLKLMALWAAIWPWSYGFVHRVYAKVTGLDKKYRVE